MNALIFMFGDAGYYVWPSYGIVFAALLILALMSFRSYRKTKKTLSNFQSGKPCTVRRK